MKDLVQPQPGTWPLGRKIIFRFFFIYFIYLIAPWQWLSIIPGADYLLGYYDKLTEWLVIKSNAGFFHVFHIKNVKPVENGSGDTSYNWAEICFALSISFIGCLVWSLLDRRRRSYVQLQYLLCLFCRYYLALVALGYGFDKIFLLQMRPPDMSQLATPLGDFLPMRFSWLFIGYSNTYQIFSGVMEVLVGLLLLYRKTATMGVLLATAVFINVMMLNLSYDIPVKLFSMNLVLMCLYLLANESTRIARFFILNRPASVCNMYSYTITKRWMRITRIVLKLLMIYLAGKSIYDTYGVYKQAQARFEVKPFNSGVYEVTKFAVNKDTLAPLVTDSIRWQDVIIEKGGYGSIHTGDTLFRKRYGRQYFSFIADTGKHLIRFKKFPQDSLPVLVATYQVPDSNTIRLTGLKGRDSIYVELTKSKRHFQLAEKQFHWLSEANR